MERDTVLYKVYKARASLQDGKIITCYKKLNEIIKDLGGELPED